MASPVALILGAGPGVGLSVAKYFSAKGWKVAAVSRTIKEDIKAVAALNIAADLSDIESVAKIFQEVNSKLGIPNVVIYNSYFTTFGTPNDPFAGASVEDFIKATTVNTTSAYSAAKLALEGFKKLPSGVPRVFIFTGNMQSGIVLAETMPLGVGKNASLYFLEVAAHAYGKDYQFYFADERMIDGGSVMSKIDGDAHAEAFWELANSKQQLPVNYTFVKGKGYMEFGVDRIRPVKGVQELMQAAVAYHEGKQ